MNSDIREAVLNICQNSGQIKQQCSWCGTRKLACGNKITVDLCMSTRKKSLKCFLTYYSCFSEVVLPEETTGDCAYPVWFCYICFTWPGSIWKQLWGTGHDFKCFIKKQAFRCIFSFSWPPYDRFLGELCLNCKTSMKIVVESDTDHCLALWRSRNVWKPVLRTPLWETHFPLITSIGFQKFWSGQCTSQARN